MHALILGPHFTKITRDRSCLIYTLKIGGEVNFGVVLKLSMKKAQVHKGCRYVFSGIIIL